MRKLGFTLAEVLITLGIIGVIATLTLPSLMTNTAEREYATAWKKAISSLTEAVQMNMAIDNINFDDLLDDSVEGVKDNNSLYALLCNRMQTERFAEKAEEACDLSLQGATGTETGCLGYSLNKTSMAANVASVHPGNALTAEGVQRVMVHQLKERNGAHVGAVAPLDGGIGSQIDVLHGKFMRSPLRRHGTDVLLGFTECFKAPADIIPS